MKKNPFIPDNEDINQLIRTTDDTEHTKTEILGDLVVENNKTSPSADSEVFKADCNYVRENLYRITELSIDALNNLKEIADRSQHPRAYEVFALLVKTIADAQKRLMELNEDKHKRSGNQPDVVQNNLFVGTTAELDSLIAKLRKKT